MAIETGPFWRAAIKAVSSFGFLVSKATSANEEMVATLVQVVWHASSTALYGYDSSVQIPLLSMMNWKASSIKPPSHDWLPSFCEQSINCCSDNEVKLF